MSRPTFQQMEGLADFLEENPGIAKGLLRTAQAKFTTKRKWEELSIVLNALGGAQKDGKGWAKYWADKKCALKKVCGQHVRSMSRTGGGPVEALPILTPIDQRLVAVMGGLEFAAGDSHVAVNPFPTPNMASFLPVSVQNEENVPITPVTPVTVTVTPACSLDNNNILVLDSAAETVDSETGNEMPMSRERERSPVRTAPVRTAPVRTAPVRTAPSSNSRRSRARQGTSLTEDRNLFAAIERQRVEAETLTAEALREAVSNISSVAVAINNLAAAVTEAAQIIAQAIISDRTHTN